MQLLTTFTLMLGTIRYVAGGGGVGGVSVVADVGNRVHEVAKSVEK